MSGKTGTLDVVENGTKVRYEWNGYEPDRDRARAAFDKATKTGAFLAVVHDKPGKAHQVRSFDEVEKIEKERGTVVVSVSPALVGG